MSEVFQVLIVEDDFRVADITKQFVEKIDGFAVVGVVKTGEETKQFFKSGNLLPHLILLDVYIPDVDGLELFWKLRKDYYQIDLIMMTAAKEVSTIEETLQGGIFDYIVKPVEFSRFQQTLERYRHQKSMLASRDEMEQEEIDRLTGTKTLEGDEGSTGDLPKGIDRITLDKIKQIMKENRDNGLTAVQVGKEIGASRSTARRYLEYMVSVKEVKAEQKYGDVGRPERRYSLS
ncbi:response regulator [Halalkalibacter lacteus]|uniref:response regulator n=1 Tax=Halalkalibacter lacteus TaxID=3090663 RepID=UPI002FC6DE65